MLGKRAPALTTTPGGALVYAFSGSPSHFACPTCFEEYRVSILQDGKVISGAWDCPACKTHFNVSPESNFTIR